MIDDIYTDPSYIAEQIQTGFSEALAVEAAFAEENARVSPAGSISVSGAGGGLGGGFAGGGGSGVVQPCFLGDTLFTMANGIYVPFRELYAQRDFYIGQFAKSFDTHNNPVAGEIADVFETIVYEYAEVEFSDGSVDEVRSKHRYFSEAFKYIEIYKLLNQFVFGEEMNRIKVERMTIIERPEGVAVYNAHIKIYQNYCANKKRVHNAKLVPFDNQ